MSVLHSGLFSVIEPFIVGITCLFLFLNCFYTSKTNGWLFLFQQDEFYIKNLVLEVVLQKMKLKARRIN